MNGPWLRIALTIAACLAPRMALCQVTPEFTRTQVRVLSLDTLPPDSVWTTIAERIYRRSLRDAFGDQVEFYSERLDVYNFPDPSFESDFEDFLVRKYENRPMDLLIAGGKTAAAFAGRLQARFAAHPPIVFHGTFNEKPVPKSAGYSFEYALKQSLDLALRVHPDTVTCSSCAAWGQSINGTTTNFGRRCPCHREAWALRICEASPSRR
jgi:hypothetical protein